MYEPVQLQGWGAGVTFINAVQVPSEKIINWRTYIHQLWTAAAFDLLPAQTILFTGLEPELAPVEGAGVSVYARNTSPANGGFGLGAQARIDGFTVEGASTGGGIFVNGYVRYLEVSNNRIRQNSGNQGGGVTIGHPALTLLDANGVIFYQDAENDHVRIHNNQIVGQRRAGRGRRRRIPVHGGRRLRGDRQPHCRQLQPRATAAASATWAAATAA